MRSFIHKNWLLIVSVTCLAMSTAGTIINLVR